MCKLCQVKAGGESKYTNTKFAKQGDLGTKVLTKRKDLGETIWTRGSVAHARWESTATHGGGYIYQLCKTDGTNDGITEQCFASTPLRFAIPHRQKVLHSNPEKDFYINMTVIPDGQGGSGWALNPFPYNSDAPCDWNPGAIGQHCSYKCRRCGPPTFAADGACPDKGANYPRIFFSLMFQLLFVPYGHFFL